ncbi:MAG: hypothetical protein ACSLEY_00865 [Candidatus Saccharimonadales bacterium]
MNVAIVYFVTLILLFALAYFTRRRFGVLGLALAAGAMLSDLWAQKLTPIIASTGFSIVIPPLATIVSVLLVLLPAILLLFSGPSYHKKGEQLLGASLFALLALALLIEPLGSALVLQGQSRVIYEWLIENRVYLVTLGLVTALTDLLFARTPSKPLRH